MRVLTTLTLVALWRLLWPILLRMRTGTAVPRFSGGSVGDDYPHAGMFSFSTNSRVENLTWNLGSAFTFY